MNKASGTVPPPGANPKKDRTGTDRTKDEPAIVLLLRASTDKDDPKRECLRGRKAEVVTFVLAPPTERTLPFVLAKSGNEKTSKSSPDAKSLTLVDDRSLAHELSLDNEATVPVACCMDHELHSIKSKETRGRALERAVLVLSASRKRPYMETKKDKNKKGDSTSTNSVDNGTMTSYGKSLGNCKGGASLRAAILLLGDPLVVPRVPWTPTLCLKET